MAPLTPIGIPSHNAHTKHTSNASANRATQAKPASYVYVAGTVTKTRATLSPPALHSRHRAGTAIIQLYAERVVGRIRFIFYFLLSVSSHSQLTPIPNLGAAPGQGSIFQNHTDTTASIPPYTERLGQCRNACGVPHTHAQAMHRPADDPRCCGPQARRKDPHIRRSQSLFPRRRWRRRRRRRR